MKDCFIKTRILCSTEISLQALSMPRRELALVAWVRWPRQQPYAAAGWWWGKHPESVHLSPASLLLYHLYAFLNLSLSQPCLLTCSLPFSLYPSPATAGKMQRQAHIALRQQHLQRCLLIEQWHGGIYGLILNLCSWNPSLHALLPQLCPYTLPVPEGSCSPQQQAAGYLIMCLICSKMLFSSVVFRASIRYWLNSSKNISLPSSYRP